MVAVFSEKSITQITNKLVTEVLSGLIRNMAPSQRFN